MKKLFVLLMALMLALPSLAGAEGLGGLGGNESGGGLGLLGILDDLLPTPEPNPNWGVVPDAADLTGGSKTLVRKNYEFITGVFFTAYAYAMPQDVAKFTDSYVAEAEKNGFTVEQTTVDGYDARKITWTDGTYALLVPNFGGQVLLLVQNGMTFGKPKPEGDYIEFEYNGTEVQSAGRVSTLHTSYYDYFNAKRYDYYYIFCSVFDDDSVERIVIDFPDSVKAGHEYIISGGAYQNGYSVDVNDTKLLSMFGSSTGELKEKEDYFKLSVISVETVYDKVMIEAEFEGRFRYGAITIKNGHFNASFPREKK